MKITSLQFIDAHKQLPEKEGLYLWKTVVDGMNVAFPAFVKKREVNGKTILDPAILSWNGFSTSLPNIPLEWTETDLKFDTIPKFPLELINEEVILLDEELPCCPFCEQTPKIVYVDKHHKSNPTTAETFFLECCDWINPNNKRDNLKELVEDWKLIQPKSVSH